MPGFTTRTLQQAEAPEQAEIARQALLKMAHHLDDSATRHLHRKGLLAKASVDELSIELTEFTNG